MPTHKTITVTTMHTEFGAIGGDIKISVPESLQEASEYFKGKALAILQTEVGRRKGNAARHALAKARKEQNWLLLATRIAEAYVVGHRGARPPRITEAEIDTLSKDALKKRLTRSGVDIF